MNTASNHSELAVPMTQSGVIATIASLCCLGILAPAPVYLFPVLTAGLGCGVILLRRHRIHDWFIQTCALWVGSGLLVTSVGISAAIGVPLAVRSGWMVGVGGLVLVVSGSLALWPARARLCVSGGTAALTILFLFVGMSGFISTLRIVVAMALLILTWNAGQRAVTLGHQMTAAATITPAEQLHIANDLTVGAGTVVVVMVSTLIPFSGFTAGSVAVWFGALCALVLVLILAVPTLK